MVAGAKVLSQIFGRSDYSTRMNKYCVVGGLALITLIGGLGCNEAGNSQPVTTESQALKPSANPSPKDSLRSLTHQQLAERIMSITGADKMGDQMIAAMTQQLSNGPAAKTIAPVMEKMRAEMPALTKLLIPIYAKRFSKDEMIDLIAFYESKSGKAMIEKMPLLMQDAMQLSQTWAKDFMSKEMPQPE